MKGVEKEMLVHTRILLVKVWTCDRNQDGCFYMYKCLMLIWMIIDYGVSKLMVEGGVKKLLSLFRLTKKMKEEEAYL